MCRCVDLYNFRQESIDLNLEYCDDSPVKKRKRKGYNSRSNPKKCVIHIDSEAVDKTLSSFYREIMESKCYVSKYLRL